MGNKVLQHPVQKIIILISDSGMQLRKKLNNVEKQKLETVSKTTTQVNIFSISLEDILWGEVMWL